MRIALLGTAMFAGALLAACGNDPVPPPAPAAEPAPMYDDTTETIDRAPPVGEPVAEPFTAPAPEIDPVPLQGSEPGEIPEIFETEPAPLDNPAGDTTTGTMEIPQ